MVMVKYCISAPAFFVLNQEKSIFSSNYTLHNTWSNSCRTMGNSVMTRGDNRLPTHDGSGTDRRSSIEVLFFGSLSGVQAPGHMRLKQTHTLDDGWYLHSHPTREQVGEQLLGKLNTWKCSPASALTLHTSFCHLRPSK
jgi:hypothetical protein